MITLTSYRSYVQTIRNNFFSIINMRKTTWLINVQHHGPTSPEYLSALTINCILEEIEIMLEKKLFNTAGQKIKFQFSDAQGIVLYRTLLDLPLPAENMYFLLIRDEWIRYLDLQIHQKNPYYLSKIKV